MFDWLTDTRLILAFWGVVGLVALGFGLRQRHRPPSAERQIPIVSTAIGAVLFILAVCWHLPSRVRRGLIVTLVAIAGGYGFLEISGPLLMPVYGSRLDDTVAGPTRDLQVIQSTGWTCGPAALAWALQLRGLPVSEKQAAFLTATTPFHGTPDRGVLRAAHRLGLAAHMERGDSYEQLLRLPRPSLVTWHLGGMVMHFVVLIGMDERGVKIGDPMLGEVDYSKDEFLAKWGRSVVVLE